MNSDGWSDREVPTCTTGNQLHEIEKEYTKLFHAGKRFLRSYTGCKPPCKYTEYKLAEEPIKLRLVAETFDLNFALTDENVIELKEVLFYPIESLIAEFGGALGLFVGFSFMMFWDIIELLMTWIRKLT